MIPKFETIFTKKIIQQVESIGKIFFSMQLKAPHKIKKSLILHIYLSISKKLNT
jgi:hypothetical protein